MSDSAIQVKHLSKQYHVGHHPKSGLHLGPQTLREVWVNQFATSLQTLKNIVRGQGDRNADRDKTFWALKDISFEIKLGEVVGIIGHNGAGKSTLLKILSRITEPTSGEALIYGRIGSLLEVGTGFHQELTGRENTYLGGAILGMKRWEIERRFDEIVDFSGVERFIDTPVKHYASGMRMRLAFAVAAHLNPEILLIDEVLSVGDAEFRKKCLRKMENIAKGGRTVVFVSHNMTTMMALCRRILYLKEGQLKMDGRSEDSIACYISDIEERVETPLAQRTDRTGKGPVRVTGMRWLDAKTRAPLGVVMSGQEVYLEVRYEVASKDPQPLHNLEMDIGIHTLLDQAVIRLNSRIAGNTFQHLPASGQLYGYIERFPLMPGQFYLNCSLILNGMVADRVLHALTTDVEAGDFFGTGFAFKVGEQSVYVPHRWLDALP